MADAHFDNFDRRLRKIARKNRRTAKGYVNYVGTDGLIIARPYRQGLRFPIRGLFLVLASLLFFKAVLIAHLGAGTYESRISALSTGSSIEQAGAWVMQADPVTMYMAGVIRPYMPQ